MRYLIDGYNLLHALGVLTGKVEPQGLEKARQRLLELLAQTFGADAPQVTVVFDASRAPRRAEAEQIYQGLQVRFAVSHAEADDLIEEMIRQDSRPDQLRVVSDDRRLQTAARRGQAHPLTSAEFLDELEALRRPAKSETNPLPEKGQRPTQEETRRWLQEFAGIEADPELKEAFERFDFEDEK